MTRGENPVVWGSWEGSTATTATTQNPTPTYTITNPQCQSLSLLPCQSVTPSYDPGESVFVCFSFYKLSLSLSLFIHLSPTSVSFILPSLSPSLSLIPNSPSPNSRTSFCPFTLFPPSITNYHALFPLLIHRLRVKV